MSGRIPLVVAVLWSIVVPMRVAVAQVVDTTPPSVSAFDFSPSLIDVSSGAASVTVSLVLTDDLSGVDRAQVNFRSPSGSQTRIAFPFARTAGTVLSGTWQDTADFPQFSEDGTWTVERVFLHDVTGNQAVIETTGLMAMGFATTLTVVSVRDVSPPALSLLSFAPGSPDVSAALAPVTVSLALTDDLSGVERAQVNFRSPSGAQTRIAFPFALTSGTTLSGTWQDTADFPRFSEDGTWTVERIFLHDEVGNLVSLTAADLVAMGLPASIEVIRPSLDNDGTIGPIGGTVQDDSFGARAQITFPAAALTAATAVAIDVFPDPLAIPTPAGFEGPGTFFVNVFLNPQPSFPVAAPGMTLTLPTVNPMMPGAPLSLFRVNPLTGMLVPATDALGVPVVGTVDPGGLSATFSGVASLSVVVGLVQPVLTPQGQLDDLIEEVEGLTASGVLRPAQGRTLTALLQGALRQLTSGRERLAAVLLRAFIAEVELLVRLMRLEAPVGNLLTDRAASIISQLK
jgi:hypothetical protein